MEAACFSANLVPVYQAERSHGPEGLHLNIYCHESFKSHKALKYKCSETCLKRNLDITEFCL